MWTLKLFHVAQVPADFREPFIVSSYRSPGLSFKCCLKSMFQKTNETLNFWTHFLPLLFFLSEVFVAFTTSIGDKYTWPFVVYLISVCTYLIGSCIAHLFNCLSEHARHVCFFIDYIAIFLYGMGTNIAYRYYVLPDALIGGCFYNAYLYITLAFCTVFPIMACVSRIGDKEKLKEKLRLISIAVSYSSMNVPTLLRVLHFFSEESWDGSFSCHIAQIIFMTTAAFLYATHIPECMAPGRFDVVGHSHQFLHVFVAIGTCEQMKGIVSDMVNRREFLETNGEAPNFASSFGLYLFVFCMNLVTVIVFSVLIKKEKLCRKYFQFLFIDRTSVKSVQNGKAKQF